MKPVIDPPSGVARDLYQGTVCCLRCEQKIDRYRLLHQSGTPTVPASHSLLPAVGTPGVHLGFQFFCKTGIGLA